MEQLLTEFIDTLEASLKRLQREAGDSSGFSHLTISQLQYIDAIHALGEPTISELAARLNLTKASVTIAINKLLRSGYVTKTRSNRDKRVFHVSLTAAADQLVQSKIQTLRAYDQFIRSALTESEARQFEGILAKLVKHFEQT
jgi:DNA-binding MarR family transcriptional regulator